MCIQKSSENKYVMKTILFFILIFLNITFTLSAQYDQTKGARQAGMGGAALFNADVWATFNNQAQLAKLEKIAIGVSFSDRFAMPELADKSAVAAFRIDKFGAIGVSYTGFGNSDFRTDKFGLAYAKQLGKRFYAGMQMNYLTIYPTALYPKVSAITGEFSLLAEPTNKFFVAASVSNPWRAKVSETTENEYLATIFKIGVGFKFSEEARFSAQVEKDVALRNPMLRTGMDYKLVAGLSLRAGVGLAKNYSEYSFGIGYLWKNIDLDMAFSKHAVLGYTPHVSLGYTFAKK